MKAFAIKLKYFDGRTLYHNFHTPNSPWDYLNQSYCLIGEKWSAEYSLKEIKETPNSFMASCEIVEFRMTEI